MPGSPSAARAAAAPAVVTVDSDRIARLRGVDTAVVGNCGLTEHAPFGKDITMGIGDKIQNAGEEAAGKVKEATGKATDNESLEAEGKGDQASANVKQAGEKAKDAVKNVFD